MIKVDIIPINNDYFNYSYLLTAENGETALIDPCEAAPIIDFLDGKGVSELNFLINTHHHWDHTDGNAEILERYAPKHVGPAKEEHIIGKFDTALHDSDVFVFGGENIQIIETPGHTAGHICFYAPDSKLLFAGDTIFSMGCGRLFEGTAEDMWHSFEKLMALPDDTALYCGHEYTLPNAKFCLEIEPDNQDLQSRHEDVKALRRKKQPTLPSSIGLEKKTNVFLRAGSAKKFAELRALKDKS